MTNSGAIGVFDSGIGGLTVLRELLERLPAENFVYFGDTARVPYGNKSSETVLKFSRENVSFLMDQGVKFVVVACNTASAEAVPVLQEEFPVPLVGVIEPGVRAATRVSRSSRIGVIGTAGTVRSGAYQKGIQTMAPKARVTARACPLFVPLVEEGWIDGDVTRAVAERYLGAYREESIDVLVLGCTHYPLLRGVISDVLGAGVTLVDSAVETADEVGRRLRETGMEREGAGGEFSVFLSDIAPNFKEVGERILGRAIPDVHLLSV
ncbi:MAG: glutamate racemase [Candidatus Krumholzibacteriia bacterium]